MIVKKLRSSKAFYNTVAERTYYLNHSQPKVGFLSAMGVGNFGDDIMIDAAQKLMTNRKILNFTRWEHILNSMRLSGRSYFEYIVLGGGTLIHNANKSQIRTVHEALEQGFSIYSLGTGVGSSGFGTDPHIAINDWKPLLSKFAKIGVRGSRSKKLLESIGIGNVEVIGDLALSFAKNQLEELMESPRFAVNVRLLQQDKYNSDACVKFREIEIATRKLVKNGWQPVPIAMHSSDVEPLKHLMQTISMEHLPIPVVSTVDEFFRIVSPCSFTVGIRLHSAVLSCCAGVPPLMLGYRDKCLDFMQSMGLEEWYLDLYTVKPDEISDKALLFADKSTELSPIVLTKAQLWKSKIKDYVADLSADIEIMQQAI